MNNDSTNLHPITIYSDYLAVEKEVICNEEVIAVPKLKESDQLQKDRLVRAYIAKNMELYILNDEQIGAKLGCTKRTFQNKKKRPETFTLRELRKLCVVIKLSDEEKSCIL